MTEQAINELQSAFAAVYRGSLEEFISRRDALAKQLRASKRRDDADAAKALRKPSRLAWVLDSAVLEDSTSVEPLIAAITSAIDVQTSGNGDLRAALDAVRSAARAFAEVAAELSARSGYSVDAMTVVPAVMAVIGDADAFAALRTGRLAEIPDGGGLDFLSAAPPTRAAVPDVSAHATTPESPASDAAARALLEQAEASLAEARARADSANRSLEDAKTSLAAAEAQLRRAQDEVAERRAELERAREGARTNAALVQDALRAVTEAQSRVSRR